MRHDLKNHVNTLNMLLSDEEHGQERAKQYLLEYVRQTAALQEFVKTKNSVADAVLNAKLMYCKEQDIPAEYPWINPDGIMLCTRKSFRQCD